MTKLENVFKDAKRALIDAGYLVSCASNIDYDRKQAYVCSIEMVDNTYGHPQGEVSIWENDYGVVWAHPTGARLWGKLI